MPQPLSRTLGPLRIALLTALLCAGGARSEAADGPAVFARICANCHQARAEGAVGLAPPLAGTLGARLASDTGRRYITGVLLFGMAGKIESNGAVYNGIMPSWAALPDEDLAAVANYVLTTFNAATLPAGFAPYTAAEFAALRAQAPSRQTVRAWRAASDPGAGKAAGMPQARAQDPALDFRLHCMGCHGADGGGVPLRGIPDLRVEVARFLRVPGGRAYLSQVPGVLNTPLDDADIARLLTWISTTFAAADAGHGFEAFTPTEIARYRREVPVNVMVERARLRVSDGNSPNALR